MSSCHLVAVISQQVERRAQDIQVVIIIVVVVVVVVVVVEVVVTFIKFNYCLT
jgi:hypothetical protein